MNTIFMSKKRIVFLFLLWLGLSTSLGLAASVGKVTAKVACVGNSITYGIGIKDRIHDSYPSKLQQMLGEDYVVGNFGRPGATLLSQGHRPYIQQPEYEEAKAFHADIVLIHLGINDTDPRDWPHYGDEFVRDYLNLIQSFREINPKVRCLVARMTPITHIHPRFISGTSQWHEQIQEAIEAVAKLSGAELIDFHSPLYPYPGLFPDAVHPNEEGAEIMAQVAYSAITGDYGGLQLSELYTDYMVLQRDVPLEIQGIANTGSKVTVRIGGQKKSALADNQGKWMVCLAPLKAGVDYQLEIGTKEEKRIFKQVAVGEVWLCSGQSNMEFMVKQSKNAQRVIADASNASIRLFDKKANWLTSNVAWPLHALDSVRHLQYYKKTQWQAATPENVSNFSAVAYSFGRLLQDSLQVPVGLICNAVGGSTTESWIDRHTLEMEFPAILKDWLHNDFIQPWARERAGVNLQLAADGVKRHPYEPCYLFEAGILPLKKYPVKGVIWYQGESNAHNMEAHERLFELLVGSWRSYWENPRMPFYFVQLSSLNRPSWPRFRDSQRRLMQKIAHTGMAVSSDWGDSLNVHPQNKFPVGERLVRWALACDYKCAVTPSGPLFKSAKSHNHQVWVQFDYGEGMHAAKGSTQIDGFELAEVDGLYYPAEARVQEGQIILESHKVNRPRFVRYAWQPFTRANLVNQEELPASTFRGEIR